MYLSLFSSFQCHALEDLSHLRSTTKMRRLLFVRCFSGIVKIYVLTNESAQQERRKKCETRKIAIFREIITFSFLLARCLTLYVGRGGVCVVELACEF